jgi:hypothetical protein
LKNEFVGRKAMTREMSTNNVKLGKITDGAETFQDLDRGR